MSAPSNSLADMPSAYHESNRGAKAARRKRAHPAFVGFIWRKPSARDAGEAIFAVISREKQNGFAILRQGWRIRSRDERLPPGSDGMTRRAAYPGL
ncbi:hypothetical protein [Cohnella nanjingensis]|uniref:hypothetical protein n=1 Tax=Cohnella nanjingensis TaxID=1387779 RepID=UPI001C88DA87|nr:hypothetical protein [Cohnella nanjingensis]